TLLQLHLTNVVLTGAWDVALRVAQRDLPRSVLDVPIVQHLSTERCCGVRCVLHGTASYAPSRITPNPAHEGIHWLRSCLRHGRQRLNLATFFAGKPRGPRGATFRLLQGAADA